MTDVDTLSQKLSKVFKGNEERIAVELSEGIMFIAEEQSSESPIFVYYIRISQIRFPELEAPENNTPLEKYENGQFKEIVTQVRNAVKQATQKDVQIKPEYSPKASDENSMKFNDYINHPSNEYSAL